MVKVFSGTDLEWDALVRRTECSGSFLQSSLWAAVQEKRRAICMRLIDGAKNPSLWIALPIKPLVWVWYCPKGPLILPTESHELRGIQAILQTKKRGALLRIEPQSAPHFEGLPGFKFRKRRDVSPSHTLVTSIAKSDDELFSSFHEKTRYNIRVAERHNIQVRKLIGDELAARADEIFSLYDQTGGRHKISPTPRIDMQAFFGIGDVWAAFYGEKIIATSIHIGFGSYMTYVHGASSYDHRALMSPYALQWNIIRAARDAGFSHYDWWGIAPENEPQHRLAGVTRFKLGFGGERVASVGTFDCGIDRITYALYTLASHIRRS